MPMGFASKEACPRVAASEALMLDSFYSVFMTHVKPLCQKNPWNLYNLEKQSARIQRLLKTGTQHSITAVEVKHQGSEELRN